MLFAVVNFTVQDIWEYYRLNVYADNQSEQI